MHAFVDPSPLADRPWSLLRTAAGPSRLQSNPSIGISDKQRNDELKNHSVSCSTSIELFSTLEDAHLDDRRFKAQI